MRWFSFPQFCKLLSAFPLREAPEIILWLFFIIFIFFIFRESSCLLFHCQSTSVCDLNLYIKAIFLPLFCTQLINPSNSFSEFSVSAQSSCPLRNVLSLKCGKQIINLIFFIPLCCIWSKEGFDSGCLAGFLARQIYVLILNTWMVRERRKNLIKISSRAGMLRANWVHLFYCL